MLTVSVLERCSQMLIINLRRHLRKNQYERLGKGNEKKNECIIILRVSMVIIISSIFPLFFFCDRLICAECVSILLILAVYWIKRNQVRSYSLNNEIHAYA